VHVEVRREAHPGVGDAERRVPRRRRPECDPDVPRPPAGEGVFQHVGEEFMGYRTSLH
jgi:hypothetical protein